MADIDNQAAGGDDHLSHDPTKSFVAKVIDWSVHNQLLVGMMMIVLLVCIVLFGPLRSC